MRKQTVELTWFTPQEQRPIVGKKVIFLLCGTVTTSFGKAHNSYGLLEFGLHNNFRDWGDIREWAYWQD